jgi:hypothetical protein
LIAYEQLQVEVPLILCVVVVTQDFVELVGALTVEFVPALTYVYDWSKASNPRPCKLRKQATHNFHPMPKHRNNDDLFDACCSHNNKGYCALVPRRYPGVPPPFQIPIGIAVS